MVLVSTEIKGKELGIYKYLYLKSVDFQQGSQENSMGHGKLGSHMQTHEKPYLIPHIHINSQWVIDLSVSTKWEKIFANFIHTHMNEQKLVPRMMNSLLNNEKKNNPI